MSESTVTPASPGNIIGNWARNKDKLKAKFPILKDKDLSFKKGKQNEMLFNVQVILGKTKEELETIISDL